MPAAVDTLEQLLQPFAPHAVLRADDRRLRRVAEFPTG
jgi:hypothetical protein